MLHDSLAHAKKNIVETAFKETEMPPWSEIETIMFDMDGTLLDLHFDNYFWLTFIPQHYAENHKTSREEALEIVRRKYKKVYGTLSFYCLDYWEQELELDIPNLKTHVRDKITVRPNVESLLQQLLELDKKLLLVTNAHPVSFNIKMKQTGIDNLFHRCISSHQLALAKENSGFWEKLNNLEPYDPKSTLLFDDSMPVLRQAKSEGIKYLYGIKQPDSQQPAVTHTEFPLVNDFSDITPT